MCPSFILKEPAVGVPDPEVVGVVTPVTALAAAPASALRPAPIAAPILIADESPFKTPLFSNVWK